MCGKEKKKNSNVFPSTKKKKEKAVISYFLLSEKS